MPRLYDRETEDNVLIGEETCSRVSYTSEELGFTATVTKFGIVVTPMDEEITLNSPEKIICWNSIMRRVTEDYGVLK